VNSIAFSGGNCATAYIGGQFTSVGSTAVKNIAAVNTSTGTVVSTFGHNAGGQVETILGVKGHLLVGGLFKGINGSSADPYYTSLSPATGKNDGFLHLGISGHYFFTGVKPNATEVYNQQLSHAGSLVLVEGDFTKVGGQQRRQIFMISVAGGSAAPTGWTSPEFDGTDPNGTLNANDKYFNCGDSHPFYIRAAAWSPSDSTVYIADTGVKPILWNGKFPLVGLCDAAAAFPPRTAGCSPTGSPTPAATRCTPRPPTTAPSTWPATTGASTTPTPATRPVQGRYPLPDWPG
jgi:hypothetical protein